MVVRHVLFRQHTNYITLHEIYMKSLINTYAYVRFFFYNALLLRVQVVSDRTQAHLIPLHLDTLKHPTSFRFNSVH